MPRKYLLPLLALLGALFGIVIVIWSQQRPPVAPILFPPPTSPFEHAIAAAGIIEASSQNISIGSPFNEVVDKIYVTEGDVVKKGDPLFQLDLRAFEARRDIALASLNAAQVAYEEKKKQFSFYQRLCDQRAVSEQAYQTALFALREAEEQVNVSEANLFEAETNIKRSIIRAPIDGEILQVNTHVGEIAPVVPFISPQATWLVAANGTLILMGDLQPLQVRIDIDENDAWRFEEGARARAFVRGNSCIQFDLTYLKTLPYIIPKSSFTGSTRERVDTRVLQVLYDFEKKDLPVYTGQILDIFIEAGPIEGCVTP